MARFSSSATTWSEKPHPERGSNRFHDQLHVADSFGRLSELSNGSGDLIVRYTYDPAGNLIQEDMGNGTCRTVYAYDANSNVKSRSPTYAPDHVTVNPFDDYT